MVKGFLDVDGRRIVNEAGEEVLLLGWGLGNWLLCEGYMWYSEGCARFDRTRRIETVIEELTGEEYAARFWRTFHDRYITEDDIRKMAEMGCNSVRIPIEARLFLREGSGIVFREEGFRLLDRAIDWCEKHGLYAIIDLHGAPGGQTGANIDDSVDDTCRLFGDQHQFDKGVALWERIAARYADRWIVGGYDLLNEPIRPVRFEGDPPMERYLPRLVEFYEACIAAIRAHDPRHIVFLEGHHWATDLDIFDHSYDPRMVIHFHRYGCAPELAAFEEYVRCSERLNAPLWLGETGENTMEWFSGLMPLALELGIGVNMWPWKKMNCFNSPCSVAMPRDWELITGYAAGGPHPSYEKAQAILDEYLDNMRFEKCAFNGAVMANALRRPGCKLAGVCFDERPGRGNSFYSTGDGDPDAPLRRETGMRFVRRLPAQKRRFVFEGEWSQYALQLRAGEFACYTLHEITPECAAEIACFCEDGCDMALYQDGTLMGRVHLAGGPERQTKTVAFASAAGECRLRVEVSGGEADVESLRVLPARKNG